MWNEQFGRDYTDRNMSSTSELNELYRKRYGITRTEMNERFIGDLDRDSSVLEAGCNIGNQLLILQEMGFKRLCGFDTQEYAIELAKKRTQNIYLTQASVFDMPFEDFDLVFTSGLLIHIPPPEINKALDEIYRVSKRYIWGFEYFADEYTAVIYRGLKGLLWKTNFCKLFIDRFPDLEIIREERFKYLENKNVDSMYLLEKV